tara:strand:- start:13327 stop:13785 length:459 start_codon:yes stop_codon:yes gene_type:complete
MKGNEYSDLIASYLVKNYRTKGLRVFREVSLGKTIIGKNRRVDIFALHEPTQKALSIECKYQGSNGTADEKIPYTLKDLEAMRTPACMVYAGPGFSEGIKHMLAAHHMAAYALPVPPMFQQSRDTRGLDHILAMTFGWWDLVLKSRSEFLLP